MSAAQQTAPHAQWLMIGATIRRFGSHQRLATLLPWPYLGEVSFDGPLCLDVWQRNPTLLDTA